MSYITSKGTLKTASRDLHKDLVNVLMNDKSNIAKANIITSTITYRLGKYSSESIIDEL